MFKRNIEEKLKFLLKSAPVVLLQGARQSGKSTLVKQIASELHYHYINLDDNRYLSQAVKNPQDFIVNLETPAIIDEVQRVPEIFLPIKLVVDDNRQPGKFLLTGSAQVLTLPGLADSLTGRMQLITLYPLSQGELLGVKDTFLDYIFRRQKPEQIEKNYPSKQEIFQRALKGGFPEVIQYKSAEQRQNWFESYITTLVQRDIKELADIDKLVDIPEILVYLASRLTGLLNISDLSSTSGISQTSLHRYLALLQALFIYQPLRPWASRLSKRLSKSAKVFFNDSGLTSYLLSLTDPKFALTSPYAGSILENFVFAELSKQITWCKSSYSLSHFRTHKGIEVDFVVEKRPLQAENSMIGIEIKAASSVGYDDFKGLRYLQNNFEKQFYRGIVLYCGDKIIPFGKNMWCMPVSCLWQSE